MAADVDGLLMAIGRWWRRRATLMPAYDQHDTRRQTTTSMSSADDDLRTMLGFLGALIGVCTCGTERSPEFGSVNHTRCLLARARGVAVMMVPAAGARYGVSRDGNKMKQGGR
jgi:hypothetical protein